MTATKRSIALQPERRRRRPAEARPARKLLYRRGFGQLEQYLLCKLDVLE